MALVIRFMGWCNSDGEFMKSLILVYTAAHRGSFPLSMLESISLDGNKSLPMPGGAACAQESLVHIRTRAEIGL